MPQCHVSAVSVLALLLTITCTVARGQNGIVWEDPTPVDTGITSISNSSGVSAQWLNDRLWVYYEKNGDIYGAAHSPAGWDLPRRLTTNPARQSDPHVCGTQVIWEDHRGSVPEIWKARFNGTTWSEESILSPDDVLVGDGMYFAVTRIAGRRVSRTVLVVR